MTSRLAMTLLVAAAATALPACKSTDKKGSKVLDDGPADPFAAVPGETGQALDVTWYAGGDNCPGGRDPFQTLQVDPSTVIMRQNICLQQGYEAPFIYLLFGDDKVLMLDTGSVPNSRNHIVDAVDHEIQAYLTSTGKTSIQLIVAHTHSHGDHVQGDPALALRANTTVVGRGAAAVQQFFGFESFTSGAVTYDLGNRTLDVMPVPGHFTDHIAIYDRKTGILLTGDSLYPGHLFVQNWPVYKESVNRLADWTADKTITHVLGAHIEMTKAPKGFIQYGSATHPLNEHVLELFKGHLTELNNALQGQTEPTCDEHNDFSIEPAQNNC